MKRKSIIVLFLISLIILFISINEKTFTRDVELLGVKVSSRIEIDVNLIGKTENTEIFHYPIQFNGNILPYDWQTNTLYIPQNMEDSEFKGDLSSEYGNLLFSDEVILDRSEKIYTDTFDGEHKEEIVEYVESIGKNEYIADNAVFKMYLIWDNNYAQYNVIFTGMPTISLTYDDYNSELMSWNGNMTLIDPYHKKNEFVSQGCEFHLRGDSTSHADKKSYELNLEDKVSLVGMRTDDDWALVAMLGDNGYVHNKLAYDLWNDISATNEVLYDNTVDCDFVEVFYDNTYAGLYLLCEKIDRKQCKLGNNDYLFRLDEIRFEDNTLPEYEKQFDFVIKWPKDYTEADYNIIRNFEKAFYTKDTFDLEEALSIVNMDNITDMNLYSMLICGVDNWDANCFYIAPKKDDFKISEVMWDMNETFGDDEWFEYREEYITSPDMMIPYVKKIYDAGKLHMSSTMNKRWTKLRKTVISKEALKQKTKDMESYLQDSGALTRETSKWYCYMNPEWRYSNIYDFIDGRIDYLDAFWEEEYRSNK